MSATSILMLVIFVLVPALILLESARQKRKWRREGRGKSTGASLVGVAMLDVQKHLQADRHVEVLQMQQKKEDVQLAEEDESGEP